jgi:hypothetical protein
MSDDAVPVLLIPSDFSHGSWMYIAVNHDLSGKSIGKMRQVGVRIQVELFEPLTDVQIFQIFGGAGILATELVDDGRPLAEPARFLCKKFEILEFSFCSAPAAAEQIDDLTIWRDKSERLRQIVMSMPSGPDRAAIAFAAGGLLGLANRVAELEKPAPVADAHASLFLRCAEFRAKLDGTSKESEFYFDEVNALEELLTRLGFPSKT